MKIPPLPTAILGDSSSVAHRSLATVTSPRPCSLSLSSRSCLAAPRAMLRPPLAGLEHELEALSPAWSSSARSAGGTEALEVEELGLGFPRHRLGRPRPSRLLFSGSSRRPPFAPPSAAFTAAASAPNPAADDSSPLGRLDFGRASASRTPPSRPPRVPASALKSARRG
jgi:hypothetical protein